MLKSMNRKFLIYTILYGFMFWWIIFGAIKPKKEDFTLSRDADGKYEKVIEEEDYRLTVSEYGEGVLRISYEPEVTWTHYFFSAIIALFLGMSHYQDLVKRKKKKEEAETEQDDFMAGDVVSPEYDDSEYQAFVSEDENRQLFPRPVLEEDFQKWRESRSEKEAGES